MTSTLQMMKPAAPMQDWKAIFPDFTTLTGSSQFIKKLMAVSLSAITYIRGVFPEKAYGERYLSGIKLKLLTEDSGIEGVNKFINLIRSCYDAVDKKYLNQLSIGICTDSEDRDNVIESYNMNFRFRDDEFLVENKSSSMKLTESDPTVEATFWLLKSILSISDILGPLPNKAFLTMKLLYNDEITPQDYEPPGFEPSDTIRFKFPENAVKLELGKVSTDIHGYKMYLKTSLSKKPLSQMIEESVLTDSQKSRNNIPHTDYEVPHDGTHESTDDIIQDSQRSVKNIACETDCPCTCKQDAGTKVLICSSCGSKQHSICYGILESEDVNSQFHCIQCINEVPFRSSQEDVIYRYEGKEQQELCAFRRALVACEPLKQVTLTQIEKQLKCSKQLAKDLTERLVSEGFIRKTGNRNKYMVNEKKISDGYQQYFIRGKNKENAENSQISKSVKETLSGTMDNSSDANMNSNFGTHDKLFIEDPFMDLAIDKEVEKLNLKGPFEKVPRRNLRRRSSQVLVENDSDKQQQPKKTRCLSNKEVIHLN